MSPAVCAERLGVRFLFDRQRRPVTPALARVRRRVRETWGLRDVSFEVGSGEGVALVGPSGAGKTTILRTIARVLHPDAGRLEVRGRVASLLSVDAGLQPALTGRENAVLLAVLAGLSRAQAVAALPAIGRRSGLGDAFERPVSSYSEGMRARLGFAVAERADPEILLLDEVHEALDHEFRGAVEERARSILAAGGIVLAAGHDHPLLERLCSRGLWLQEGTLRADGPFSRVHRAYLG